MTYVSSLSYNMSSQKFRAGVLSYRTFLAPSFKDVENLESRVMTFSPSFPPLSLVVFLCFLFCFVSDCLGWVRGETIYTDIVIDHDSSALPMQFSLIIPQGKKFFPHRTMKPS